VANTSTLRAQQTSSELIPLWKEQKSASGQEEHVPFRPAGLDAKLPIVETSVVSWFFKGDRVTTPGGVQRGVFHPEGYASVQKHTSGTVTGDHVSSSGHRSYDVDFDSGTAVSRVPADSLRRGFELPDALDGPLIVIIGIFLVIAAVCYFSLWAGAQIDVLAEWPKGFKDDKTFAGFVVAICLVAPIIGLRMIASLQARLSGIVVLALGLIGLYTLPRAAQSSLINSWRYREGLVTGEWTIKTTLDRFAGRPATADAPC
jgi:hypothetical protein